MVHICCICHRSLHPVPASEHFETNSLLSLDMTNVILQGGHYLPLPQAFSCHDYFNPVGTFLSPPLIQLQSTTDSLFLFLFSLHFCGQKGASNKDDRDEKGEKLGGDWKSVGSMHGLIRGTE